MPDKVWIPEISEGEVREINKRIKIVVDFPRMGKYYIKKTRNLHGTFLWDINPSRPAKDLEVLRDIKTYHKFERAGWFYPSIWDVIAQIPKDILDQVVAFEIIGRPMSANDVNKEPEALAEGYHVATTRLYSKNPKGGKDGKKTLDS